MQLWLTLCKRCILLPALRWNCVERTKKAILLLVPLLSFLEHIFVQLICLYFKYNKEIMFHNSLTAQTRYFGCTFFACLFTSVCIDKVTAVLVRRFHKYRMTKKWANDNAFSLLPLGSFGRLCFSYFLFRFGFIWLPANAMNWRIGGGYWVLLCLFSCTRILWIVA